MPDTQEQALREALEKCLVQFRFCANEHDAKQQHFKEQGDYTAADAASHKASINRQFAAMIVTALAQPHAPPPRRPRAGAIVKNDVCECGDYRSDHPNDGPCRYNGRGFDPCHGGSDCPRFRLDKFATEEALKRSNSHDQRS